MALLSVSFQYPCPSTAQLTRLGLPATTCRSRSQEPSLFCLVQERVHIHQSRGGLFALEEKEGTPLEVRKAVSRWARGMHFGVEFIEMHEEASRHLEPTLKPFE